ncbi:MAG: hypothetical protein H0X37_13590 [Herpetosiphonaceae bacterium]|nr:hypothetical protein [Herpetosiphonaceae bacterium]
MATTKVQKRAEATKKQTTPRPAYRLTVERAKEIAEKARAVDVLLELHDGPVVQPKNTATR